MKQVTPADPARSGSRLSDVQAVPLRADVFALPARRLRDLTRAELATREASGERSLPAPAEAPETNDEP